MKQRLDIKQGLSINLCHAIKGSLVSKLTEPYTQKAVLSISLPGQIEMCFKAKAANGDNFSSSMIYCIGPVPHIVTEQPPAEYDKDTSCLHLD